MVHNSNMFHKNSKMYERYHMERKLQHSIAITLSFCVSSTLSPSLPIPFFVSEVLPFSCLWPLALAIGSYDDDCILNPNSLRASATTFLAQMRPRFSAPARPRFQSQSSERRKHAKDRFGTKLPEVLCAVHDHAWLHAQGEPLPWAEKDGVT